MDVNFPQTAQKNGAEQKRSYWEKREIEKAVAYLVAKHKEADKNKYTKARQVANLDLTKLEGKESFTTKMIRRFDTPEGRSIYSKMVWSELRSCSVMQPKWALSSQCLVI